MSETELNVNILTPLEENTIKNTPNNFDGKQKFIIKPNCPCQIYILNIYSICFYIILYVAFTYLVENIFLIIFIFEILIIIQISLTIRAFKKKIKKTELIKDIQNNSFEINTLNYFNSSISKITLDLNSINFYDVSYEFSTDDGYSYIYGLIIVNTFQNKSIIDLDRSDIRNKPRKNILSIR